MPNELALLDNFDKAKALIAEADLVEAIGFINTGEALKVYATKAKKGLEIQNQCAEIKIRAERRAGEILAGMEKNPGAKGIGVRFHDVTTPKLEDLGVSKTQSHRWQLEVSLPSRLRSVDVAAGLVWLGPTRPSWAGHIAQCNRYK